MGAVVSLLAGSGGCLSERHPLSSQATTEILFDTGSMFAADLIDDNGNAVLPRQEPYEKLVQLRMTLGGEPEDGGFVDVRLEPRDVLTLVPTHPSCEQLSGAFRCTAEDDGFAQFTLRSTSDRAGTVTLRLIGGKGETQTFTVVPAGLPAAAGQPRIIIGGIDEDGTDIIPATNARLQCALQPVPDTTLDKWPQGQIRVREARVRATPPAALPGVVQHAPVTVHTLHPESAVSLDPGCEDRRVSVRVQMNELGESSPFYVCFSDLGGDDIVLSASSGEKGTFDRVLNVAAEPRTIRLRTLEQGLIAGSGAVAILEITALDAERQKIPLRIDVRSTDPTVLQLTQGTVTLAGGNVDLGLALTALVRDPGEATIQVSPEFFSEPVCLSEAMVVQASP